MIGFNVKDGVAYKVELPDDDTAVVTEAGNDDAGCNVASMKLALNGAKSELSNMLLGIGNEVTDAYSRIHAKKTPYDKPPVMVTVYDMHDMTEKYQEYYRAMAEYVALICDIKDKEIDTAKAIEKINRALSNDPGFIHSLADTDKMDLERCMKQIECVVEIIHDIDARSSQICQIFSKAPQNEMRDLAERLICNSVCKFTANMVKYTTLNICALKQILSGKSPAKPVEGTPSNAYVML